MKMPGFAIVWNIVLVFACLAADTVEMGMLGMQAAFVNKDADWKPLLVDERSKIEIYYDLLPARSRRSNAIKVRLKEVYPNGEAAAEAIRKRARGLGDRPAVAPMGPSGRKTAYSIRTADVSCAGIRIGFDGLVFDYDRDGTAVGFFPGVRSEGLVIAGTGEEAIYRAVCPNEKTVPADAPAGSAHTDAGPADYTDPVSGMEFIRVKGGCYHRSANRPGADGSASEGSGKRVCVDGFLMGRYEVTRAEWESVTGAESVHVVDCGPRCPADFVSWTMATEFAEKLSVKTGRRFRLPTEAEWEYAATGGGRETKYAGTDREEELPGYAWYSANSEGRIHAVGGKKPNAFGLYDMSGNVWEAVRDWYNEDYYRNGPEKNPPGPASGKERVIKGGAYYCIESAARARNRGTSPPKQRSGGQGFRLVLEE